MRGCCLPRFRHQITVCTLRDQQRRLCTHTHAYRALKRAVSPRSSLMSEFTARHCSDRPTSSVNLPLRRQTVSYRAYGLICSTNAEPAVWTAHYRVLHRISASDKDNHITVSDAVSSHVDLYPQGLGCVHAGSFGAPPPPAATKALRRRRGCLAARNTWNSLSSRRAAHSLTAARLVRTQRAHLSLFCLFGALMPRASL